MKAPKIPANVQADWRMAAVLLVGVVGLYFLAKREIGAAAAAVGGAVNVTSKENVVNKGVNAVIESTYGADKPGNQTLGEMVYARLHGDEYAAQQQRLTPALRVVK